MYVVCATSTPPGRISRMPRRWTCPEAGSSNGASAWQQRLPRSSRTVSGILRQAGRIRQRLPHAHAPLERPDPMSRWQLDCKAVSTVPADAQGKQQQVVEVLTSVDMGTSILVAAQVRADFTAETTLQAVAELLRTQGRPQLLTFDRDTRFVSSPQGSDFPWALVRLCHCLGGRAHLRSALPPPQRSRTFLHIEPCLNKNS